MLAARKELGDEYFLIISVNKCSIMRYKEFGAESDKVFGYHNSPQAAFHAAKEILGK